MYLNIIKLELCKQFHQTYRPACSFILQGTADKQAYCIPSAKRKITVSKCRFTYEQNSPSTPDRTSDPNDHPVANCYEGSGTIVYSPVDSK